MGKRPLWSSSLGAKFVLLVATILIVTLGSIALVNFHAQNRAFHDNLQSQGRLLGDFLASISPYPILSYDFTSLDKYVREVTKHEDIVYAVVFARDGNNLTSYLDKEAPLIAATIDTAVSRNFLSVYDELRKNRYIIHMEFPISLGNSNLGKVVLGVSRLKAEAHATAELQRQLLGSLGVILVLGVCIYLVFRVNTLRPIQRLIQGSAKIAQGDLNQQIKVFADDELGNLTRAFNIMARRLQKSTREKDRALEELQNLNKTLEQRVDQRTQELAIANQELEHLALHDPLTGLPNRTLAQDRLDQAIHAAQRQGLNMAVLMMDLDRFKEINDTLGHNVGDQLLKEVSVRLQSAVRDTDTVARLGGDEFAIVLPQANQEQSIVVAQHLLKALEPPIQLDGMSFSIGASLGIAIYPTHGNDRYALLKRADVAMYVAKQNRTGYFVYDMVYDETNANRLALMGDLRATIQDGALQLHYQPLILVQSGELIGVEALVRWPHPSKGMIPQEMLISMVEQSDFIRTFTLWVLGTAMTQWAEWRAHGLRLRLSVNLSMRNLQDLQLPNEISVLLDKHNMQPERLLLEVTESAMMNDPGRTHEVLDQLHKIGIQIAIDDFGIGYSSLNHLSRLPVNELKIDRAFVRHMDENPSDAMIVRSTIDLAHNLNLKVVAEGVESREVLLMLRELGCDMAQGYYLGRPAPAEELAETLRRATERTTNIKSNVLYL